MKELLCSVHHIGLPTSNMDDTIDFYTKLGAEVVFEKIEESTGKPIRIVHLQLSNILFEVYERVETATIPGSLDHIAFKVTSVEAAFKKAKENKLNLLFDKIGYSTYWPNGAQWFIVIGPNGERVEFTA